MSFLKKLGEVVLKGIALFTGISPYLQAAIPGQAANIVKASDDLTKIGGIVISIEQIAAALQLSGPDKLKAAGPLVSQIILQSDLVVGHKIKDAAKFQAGIDQITSGVVGVLNSLDADAIKVVDAG